MVVQHVLTPNASNKAALSVAYTSKFDAVVTPLC